MLLVIFIGSWLLYRFLVALHRGYQRQVEREEAEREAYLASEAEGRVRGMRAEEREGSWLQ